MHPKSHNQWLSTFEVGERRYLETTLDRYASDMRTVNTPASRRPPHMKTWRFTAHLFTAIAAASVGDVRYLLCIERKE